MKNKIFSLIIVAILAAGCSTDKEQIIQNDSLNFKSVESYLSFITADTDNRIIVKNLSSIEDPNFTSYISVFSKNESALTVDLNETTFNPLNVFVNEYGSAWGTHTYNFEEAYGTDIELSTNHFNSAVTFYSPERIEITLSNLDNNKIIPGTQVSWNADSRNENGVVLAMEYSPAIQTDSEIAGNYPEAITGGIVVADNGSYTITANDLDSMPEGALVSFLVARAGFAIETNQNTDISIGIFSGINVGYRINK